MSAVGSPAPIDAAPPAPAPRRASELLTLLTSDIPTERVTIDQIMRALGERGFGLLIIFFSLPCFVPIPGLAEICGVPILILGAQMALGRKSPRLPGLIAQRSLKRDTIRTIVTVVQPRLRKIESVLKPRWPMLFTPTMDRLLGVFVILCAIAVIFPFPGTNVPVAIAMIMISMAVMEEDGVTLSAGLLIGTAGLAYSSVVIVTVGWFTLKMLAKMIVA
jgi:hypothetical protein